ncbi:MAG: hypothetical protein WCG25_02395 [bacterium]
MSVGQKLKKKSDKMILSSFSQRKETSKEINIKNSLLDLKSTSANEMANIIKNISLNATDESLNDLKKINILTDSEKQDIKSKISLMFISSCNKNN